MSAGMMYRDQLAAPGELAPALQAALLKCRDLQRTYPTLARAADDMLLIGGAIVGARTIGAADFDAALERARTALNRAAANADKAAATDLARAAYVLLRIYEDRHALDGCVCVEVKP